MRSLPGLVAMALSDAAAHELAARLDHPTTHPARPPRPLPMGTRALLRRIYHVERGYQARDWDAYTTRQGES